jgi:hypothetical protein
MLQPWRCASRLAVAVVTLAAVVAPRVAEAAAECRVATSDFCVCCPPSDCRKEEAFCPGGTAGLLLLKTTNPGCAINVFDASRCRSGGVIASEMTSAIGVYVQGQRARIDLSQEQLDVLVGQLEELRR